MASTYSDRQALVLRTAEGEIRWSYSELWERAVEVACALRACGVDKETRVGVLMTNRPEWISAVFGVSLAGGVAVTLSTFSTASELGYFLKSSSAAMLLFERSVLKTDFAKVLSELDPRFARWLQERCSPKGSHSSVISQRSEKRRPASTHGTLS